MSYSAGLAARGRLAGGRRELDLARKGYLSRAILEVGGDVAELGRATVDSARAWRRGLRVAADIARARNGFDTHQGDVIGFSIIPGYVSTSEALQAMQLLDGEIKAANNEMFLRKVSDAAERDADPKFEAFFLGPWSDFIGRWSTFYDANKGLWDRFIEPNDIYNRTQQFRKTYIDFRAQAESLGFDWQSPAPMAPESEKHGLLDASGKAVNRVGGGLEDMLWTIVKFTLIGGAILLAVVFIGQKLGSNT